MGAGNSKPGGGQGAYEWKVSDTPNVSLDVLESLQSNNETDDSRARLMEQHIQARVAEELKKLLRQESEALRVAREKMASSQPASSSDEDDKDAAANKASDGPSRHSVSKEVEALRSKLEARKQLRPLPDGVESARSDVVRCLREKDGRPLDCWQQVEAFKAEVKKLEKDWVDKVMS